MTILFVDSGKTSFINMVGCFLGLIMLILAQDLKVHVSQAYTSVIWMIKIKPEWQGRHEMQQVYAFVFIRSSSEKTEQSFGWG